MLMWAACSMGPPGQSLGTVLALVMPCYTTVIDPAFSLSHNHALPFAKADSQCLPSVRWSEPDCRACRCWQV